MQPSLVSFFVAAALVPVSTAATYYVSPNCATKYPGISASFEEAWAMASNVAAKMGADNDENQKFVYSQLFKSPDGDTNKAQTRNYFSTLGDLTLVTDAKDADLIYDCDNDDRWEDIPERDNQFKDEQYHMRTSKNTPGCRKRIAGKPSVIMNTYRGFVPTDGWKEGRTVVSVCDKLQRSFGNWATVSKFDSSLLAGTLVDPDGNPQQVPSILDNPCTSRTILHEAFHSRLIDPHKIDLKPKAYGWANVVNMGSAEQFTNADNFAIYAFALEVFRRGYKLEDNEEAVKGGILVKVSISSKRAMRAVRSLPFKCRNWVYRRAGRKCKL